MSLRPSAPCTHERRPGTTICLLCRRDERAAASAQRRRTLIRAGGTGLAIVTLVGAGAGVVSATQADGDRPSPAVVEARSAAAAAAPAKPAGTTVAAMVAATPTRIVAPIVPEGRTDLGGGAYAVRTGDTVRVHFDTPATRTRRPEKFERTVRLTLAAAFGAAADSALAAVAPGRLTGGASLLGELPARGVHLRLTSGATLSLWPETRPGEDGPLVVTYRAVVTR